MLAKYHGFSIPKDSEFLEWYAEMCIEMDESSMNHVAALILRDAVSDIAKDIRSSRTFETEIKSEPVPISETSPQRAQSGFVSEVVQEMEPRLRKRKRGERASGHVQNHRSQGWILNQTSKDQRDFHSSSQGLNSSEIQLDTQRSAANQPMLQKNIQGDLTNKQKFSGRDVQSISNKLKGTLSNNARFDAIDLLSHDAKGAEILNMGTSNSGISIATQEMSSSDIRQRTNKVHGQLPRLPNNGCVDEVRSGASNLEFQPAFQSMQRAFHSEKKRELSSKDSSMESHGGIPKNSSRFTTNSNSGSQTQFEPEKNVTHGAVKVNGA